MVFRVCGLFAMQVIDKGGLKYRGTAMHTECFKCGYCSKLLANEQFASKDDKQFCSGCYGQLFAKRCTRCQKPITGTRTVINLCGTTVTCLRIGLLIFRLREECEVWRSACLYVCLFVCLSIHICAYLKITRPYFTIFSVHEAMM